MYIMYLPCRTIVFFCTLYLSLNVHGVYPFPVAQCTCFVPFLFHTSSSNEYIMYKYHSTTYRQYMHPSITVSNASFPPRYPIYRVDEEICLIFTLQPTMSVIHWELYTLYIVHCTLHTLQPTMSVIHWELYTVYTVHCTLHTLQPTMSVIHWELYTVYIVHCTLHTLQCIIPVVHRILYTVYIMHCTLYSVQCTV